MLDFSCKAVLCKFLQSCVLDPCSSSFWCCFRHFSLVWDQTKPPYVWAYIPSFSFSFPPLHTPEWRGMLAYINSSRLPFIYNIFRLILDVRRPTSRQRQRLQQRDVDACRYSASRRRDSRDQSYSPQRDNPTARHCRRLCTSERRNRSDHGEPGAGQHHHAHGDSQILDETVYGRRNGWGRYDRRCGDARGPRGHRVELLRSEKCWHREALLRLEFGPDHRAAQGENTRSVLDRFPRTYGIPRWRMPCR